MSEGIRVSAQGGGFFFGSFSRSVIMLVGFPTAGFGPAAWTTMAICPFKGRWVNVRFTDTAATLTGVYYMQLALGAPGSEVLWQPSINGGVYTVGFPFTVPAIVTGNELRDFSFPTLIPSGSVISVRCGASTQPGVTALQCEVDIFG